MNRSKIGSAVGKLCIYALLIGGSLVFMWPFLWMATTSVKLDREMFGGTFRLWPQTPVPTAKSPYIDTLYYEDAAATKIPGLASAIVTHLRNSQIQLPTDIEREPALQETAQGILDKLESI